LGCSKVGLDITAACPDKFEPNRDIIHKAVDFGKMSKSDVNITENPKKAVKDADIVYTDVFHSFGEKKEKRLKVFLPKFQVNRKLLSQSSDALFMHPFPIKRGEEVTYDMVYSQKSIILSQLENRIHVQKALLIKMMGKKIIEV
jgi:ornithine carbamoyltransferase